MKIIKMKLKNKLNKKKKLFLSSRFKLKQDKISLPALIRALSLILYPITAPILPKVPNFFSPPFFIRRVVPKE